MRFSDRTDTKTLVKLMTDGVLLAEIQRDRWLEQYDAIILDEAHERSLNIDLLIGYLKRVIGRRPDFRLIVTSATIDAERFAEHFGDAAGPAPIFTIAGQCLAIAWTRRIARKRRSISGFAKRWTNCCRMPRETC
jgi:ATP-dependent helicase HrpA